MFTGKFILIEVCQILECNVGMGPKGAAGGSTLMLTDGLQLAHIEKKTMSPLKFSFLM